MERSPEVPDDYIAQGEGLGIDHAAFINSIAEHAKARISDSPGLGVDLHTDKGERITTDDVESIIPDEKGGSRLKIVLATAAGAATLGFAVYEVIRGINKIRPKDK